MAKPRLFITTDMQMITGVNHINGDKDDVQSLVHALMYQDKLNIVGIGSSTSKHQPGANDVKFIHHVIDEYAQDHAKLASHGAAGDFKTASQLHKITYQGAETLAKSASSLSPATATSNAIIKEARAAADAGEKLYVATWGGMGDVARALKDAPDIADNIRLISASGPAQEPNAYKYVKDTFAGEGDLWWIDAQTTQRGIYAGKDRRLDPEFDLKDVEALAKGHGTLGTFFYENSIDVRGKGDDYSGLKMSDSHTILYLIDNADNSNPQAESWGGEYRKVGDMFWQDRTERSEALNWEGSNGARTTYEDRAAWMSDFAKRFDWLKNNENEDEGDNDNDGDNDSPSDTGDLRISVSGDQYRGSPQFEVRVDGDRVGTFTATADHRKGQWQDVVIDGDWGRDENHTVKITFLNDAFGGSSSTDRNLWVRSVSLNGETAGKEARLDRTGSSVTTTFNEDEDEDENDRSNADANDGGDKAFVFSIDNDAVDTSAFMTTDESRTSGFQGKSPGSGEAFDDGAYRGAASDDGPFLGQVASGGAADDANLYYRLTDPAQSDLGL